MDEKERSQFQIADRRFWAEDESVFENAEIPERKYPSYVEELKGRTELAERKLKEKLQKLDADNDAFRERLTRDLEKRLQREKEPLLTGLLEVADNLERALEASADLATLKEGVRLSLDLFLARLKAAGVEPVDPLNEPFDPHQAEAVGMVPVDREELDHHVVEVLQRGYRIGDQLMRPAKVRVGRYTPQTE